MLSFFRSSKSIVVIVIVIIGVLTWLQVLLASLWKGVGESTTAVFSDKYGAFLFQLLSGWLAFIPDFFVWFGLVLLLLAAIILIFVNARLHLNDKISFLPALCYILLIGGVPYIHLFSPVIIATMMLVAVFFLLVGSFENEHLSYRYFIVPAIISFATFFYQYMYFYMLVVWLVIALWRPGYWREWVFSVLGFALPLFFVFAWFFLVEDDLTQMGVFFSEAFSVYRVIPSLPVSVIIFFAIIIALVVFVFGYVLRYISSKKTAIRTGYYLLMLIVFITLLMVLIVPDTMPQAWYLLAFPLSFIISNYLANVKSKRLGFVVLVILFVGVIVAQTFFYFGM